MQFCEEEKNILFRCCKIPLQRYNTLRKVIRLVLCKKLPMKLSAKMCTHVLDNFFSKIIRVDKLTKREFNLFCY